MTLENFGGHIRTKEEMRIHYGPYPTEVDQIVKVDPSDTERVRFESVRVRCEMSVVRGVNGEPDRRLIYDSDDCFSVLSSGMLKENIGN